MRPLRTLLITAVLVAVAPVSAHAAAPLTYRGTCTLKAVKDTTNRWNGVVAMAVVPTDASNKPAGAVGVTAWCELRVNGESKGSVLGPRYFTGASADAGQLPPFSANGQGSVFELCDHVRVGADEVVGCHTGTTSEGVPDQTYDAACFIFSEAFCDTLKGTSTVTVLDI